jgi:hypothetical protein
MGVGGQLHAPVALTPGKRPGTQCTGGWVGPRAGLDGCGKYTKRKENEKHRGKKTHKDKETFIKKERNATGKLAGPRCCNFTFHGHYLNKICTFSKTYFPT